MNISIFKAAPKHLAMVVRIGVDTFDETWGHAYSAEDMRNYMNEAFDLNKIRKELEDIETNTFLMVTVEGEMAGYAKLRRDSVFEETKGSKTIELERFYFMRKFHGKGVAQTLMEKVLKLSRDEYMEWVVLGVDVNNFRAIRFYTRYGFEVFGHKIFRVGSVEDNDQLMKLKLS